MSAGPGSVSVPATAAGRWVLLAGPTGAGKSTVAGEMQRRGAVAFAIDEWMQTLFWADCPAKNDLPWALERVRRCEEQIAAVATALARRGVEAVLDLGFTQREQRAWWLERGRAAGIAVELLVVDAAPEVRWARVCGRNRGESDTFQFVVSRDMFELMETMWEEPTAEERASFAPPAWSTSTASA